MSRPILPCCLLLLCSCGGSTANPSEAPLERPTASSAAEPTHPPQRLGAPEVPPNGGVPFELVMTNQSFDIDPVDIDVFIDGVHVVAGDFVVGTQHTWTRFGFDLQAGEHTLRAASSKAGTENEQSFTIAGTKRWAFVALSFRRKPQGGAPADQTPSLSITLLDDEPHLK